MGELVALLYPLDPRDALPSRYICSRNALLCNAFVFLVMHSSFKSAWPPYEMLCPASLSLITFPSYPPSKSFKEPLDGLLSPYSPP